MNALALSLCQTHQKLVLAGVIRSEDDGVDVPDQDDEGASGLQTYDPSNVAPHLQWHRDQGLYRRHLHRYRRLAG